MKQKNNDVQKFPLKGKVKIYKNLTYKAMELDNGQIVKGNPMSIEDDESGNYLVKFNEKGFMIEAHLYSLGGDMVRKWLYFYDDDNNKTETHIYDYQDSLSVKKYMHQPDEQGNVWDVVTSIKCKNIYLYDKNGNEIEYQDLYPDGKIFEKITYQYDEQGNLIEENRYNYENHHRKIVHHRAKHQIEEFWYNLKGHLFEHAIISFNKKGNMLEQLWRYLDEKIEEKTICKYNKEGQPTSETTYFNNEICGKVNFKYNQQGYLIEVKDIHYDDKKESLKYTYLYDEQGNKIEKNEYDYKGVHTQRTLYKYDEKGNEISFYRQHMKEWFNRMRYTCSYLYDEQGNKIEVITYNEKGSISSKTIYDNKGSVIEHIEYRKNGTIQYKEKREIKYDENGNITEKTCLKHDYQERTNYQYDENKNLICEKVYNSGGGLSSEQLYKYDTQNRVIQIEKYWYRDSGKVSKKRIVKYNEDGDRVEKSLSKDNDNLIINETYKMLEYDEQGNCIKRIAYQNGKPIYITEREIEYY